MCELMQADNVTTAQFASVVEQATRVSARIRHSAWASEQFVGNVYIAVAEYDHVPIITKTLVPLCLGFPLVATLEIEEGLDAVSKYANGLIAVHDYPNTLRNLNTVGCTFAVNPEGLTYPAVNIDLTSASQIVEKYSDNALNLLAVCFKRNYLSWSPGDGKTSGCTAGNYCALLCSRDKFNVEIGIEQFSDNDTPVIVIQKLLSERLIEDGI